MRQNRQTFAIGLFVLVGFVLFALGCVLFGGSDLFAQKIYFETYFDSSVQGLDVGGPVKFRGVKIGSVESIGFAGATYGDLFSDRAGSDKEALRALTYVRVLCAIDTKHHPDVNINGLQRMVAHGLRTSLALQGITGVIYINLDFSKGETVPEPFHVPWVPETLHIPSAPSSTQQIVSAAEEIADQLPKAIDALTALADDVREVVNASNIPALTKDFRELAQTLSTQAKHFVEVLDTVQAEELSRRLITTLDEVATTVRSLREEMPKLSGELQGTMQSTRHSLDQANGTLGRANALIEELTKVAAEARANTDTRELGETLSAIARTTAALEALVNELREKPSRLIFDEPLD